MMEGRIVFGQNEANKWYFGLYTGLDFMTTPPSTIAVSSMWADGGCASYADAGGNLLFYTKGTTVWDKTHNVMANGGGLAGYGDVTQSALILRRPNSQNIYYVFTLSAATPTGIGFCYSTIDMSLALGNGSVTIKNSVLFSGNQKEMLAATRHCNGIDYWVTAYSTANNSFKTFLVTAAGVQTTAVTTPFNFLSGLGWETLKFSPSGRKFAAQIGANVYYGDFDNSTGQFSNIQLLQSYIGTGYGCEFSPDGTKLYTSGISNGLTQYNLCQSSLAAIQASSVLIVGSNAASDVYSTMQNGTDGKLYVTHLTGGTYLAVINNPNLPGLACNYINNAINFSPKIVIEALPNFPSNLFYKKPQPPPFQYAFSNLYGCYGASFTAAISATNSPCAAVMPTVTGLAWDFGDPASGANNISFSANVIHQFSGNGTYSVQLVYYYACGIANDTLRQIVNVNQNCLTISSNSITCASLGTATITNAVGTGPFTFTWLPTNQNGTIAIGLQPGTHTILATDLSVNYTYTNVINFLPVIPLTGIISNTNFVACNAAGNGTGQVSNLQGGSGSQSYLWTNGAQSFTTAFTNSLSAGIWSVNVTDALTGCQINQSFFISQPPPLSPSLSISSPTICAGSSAILTATNSGGTPGYTYSFVTGPTNFSASVTESISGNYVYTVQSSDANNCSSSATVALNVIALPGLTVPSVSICPTTQALFTANGATSYTWLPPAANGSVTTSAASTTANIFFTDNPLANTQYTLVGSALGCSSSITTSAFIYASPVPIISSNSPKCEGSTAVLSVSGGTGAVWSGPAIFSATTLTTSVSNLSVANAGVYSTTITSVEGCTASATSSFVVNPTPTISAVGSTVCTTQTMSLFATSLVGSGYQWFGANNFWSLLQNPTLANPTLNRTGSYTVLVTAPTSCTNTAIAQVSVTTPPSPSVVLSSNSLCAQAFNGSPNTITLTPSGASTYTLYTPNLLGSSTPIAPSASLFATTPYSSTLASGIATLQGSNGVCVNTSTFTFTVIPNPTVGINSYTPVICAGKNFTYTSNGASSYVWTATTPNYTTYSNGGVAVAHPSINAVFSVYGGSLGCNSALQSSSITVYPLPTITLSALSSSICLNDKTNLSVTGTGTSFQWLPATGLNSYSTNNVICGTQVNQVYTVIASVNNCTAAATSSVHVWSLPTAVITSTTANVCLGDNFYLSGSGGLGYTWFGPSAVSVSGQSVSIKAWSPALAGTYTLVVSDENNCKNKTTTNISILSLPEGQFKNFNDEACAPYCATYKFEGFNSKNIQSTWHINQSTITANVFDYCFTQAGTYTLQGNLLDVNTACKSNVSYLINVHPKPNADFSFLPKTPIENLDEVVFTNLSAGDGLLSYHWYFNDNKGFSTTNKNTSYLYAEPGDYRVALVAKNNFNCADTILKSIHVESDFALYVPNTFTPNDDNRNDVFLASVRSSKLFDLKIYDRWGQEIFHSKSPQDGWDGTYRGEACKQDTYTWVIELSTVSGERVAKTGTVLLMR